MLLSLTQQAHFGEFYQMY